MDELSLLAIAGTTTSSAQTETVSDPVDATPTPVDDAEFAAALKIYVPEVDDTLTDDTAADVSIVGETTDDTEAAEGAAGLPIESVLEHEEDQVAENNSQAVWTIGESGIVFAHRPLPAIETPHVAKPTGGEEEDQSSASDVHPTPDALAEPANATLVLPSDVAETAVAGQPAADASIPQANEADTGLISSGNNAETNAAASSNTIAAVIAAPTPAATPGSVVTGSQVPPNAASLTGDHVVPSEPIPEHAVTTPADAATSPVPTVLTESTHRVPSDRVPSDRVPSVLTRSIEPTPAVLTPSIEPTPAVLTPSIVPAPAVPTPSVDRVPTVLTPSETSVPAVPMKTIPTAQTPSTAISATILTPPIARVPTVLAAPTVNTPSIPAPLADNVQTVLPSATDSVPTRLTPSIENLQAVVSSPTDSLPIGRASSGIVPSDVIMAAAAPDEAFQEDSPKVTSSPAIESEGFAPAALSSFATNTSSANTVSAQHSGVPQPMTSQVLVRWLRICRWSKNSLPVR